MQNITIFCSASDTVAPIYKNEAETVGQWIGTHHKTLVYGGANGGLMEIVAKEVRDNGSIQSTTHRPRHNRQHG